MKNMRRTTASLMAIQSLLLAVSLNFASTSKAQESSYPLLAMKLAIIPELIACNLPYGYDGGKCPVLNYEAIEPYLQRSEAIAEAKPSPPSPPNQAIPLAASGLHGKLDNYRKALKSARLAPEERQSIVIAFDFGNPSSSRPSALDLVINWNQAGVGCNRQPLKETKGKPYLVTVPPSHRYVIYHQSADQFIPCSSVTWTVTPTNKSTGKAYSSWAFQTAP